MHVKDNTPQILSELTTTKRFYTMSVSPTYWDTVGGISKIPRIPEPLY